MIRRLLWYKNNSHMVSPSDQVASRDRRAAIASLMRDERGESITEVLVSVLIGGLAVLMLATTIASSVNIVNDGNDAMNSYYSFTNKVASGSGAEGIEGAIVVADAVATDSSSEVAVSFNEWQDSGNDARMVSYEKKGE